MNFVLDSRREGKRIGVWASCFALRQRPPKHAKRREKENACRGELLADTPHADTPIRLLGGLRASLSPFWHLGADQHWLNEHTATCLDSNRYR